MPTECTPEQKRFARLERRYVVEDFSGGAQSSDAGSPLPGAADHAVGLIDRFTACFRDGRDRLYTVHELRTLIGGRVFGVLDLDATDDPVHAKQEGRFFHG